jgi:LPXTG-site transpeptidase (sortase) family protein
MAAQQLLQPNPPRTAPVSRPIGRALLWPAAAVGLGALLIYNSFGHPAPAGSERPAAVTTAAPSTLNTPQAQESSAAGVPALPRSVPKRLSIPAIAVNAPFTPLTIGKTGQLNAPPANNTNLVGWFQGGATPGERGASIVAGHVDTKTGPAVFLLLSQLKKGSTVDITREDGTVARFKVDSVDTFSKADFPNEKVYADTPTPQLRLITCGGDYDRKAKDYEDNVVVFAHLDATKRS